MITSNEVKVLDINAEHHGTPPESLMEHAGKHVADFIQRTFNNPKIVVVCGLGNNGGDGFVAARYLAKTFPVDLYIVGKEEKINTAIARMNFSKLKSLPVHLHDHRHFKNLSESLHNATVIVDAMLGVGIKGELRAPYDEIVTQINHIQNKHIISVDIPTGFGSSLSIHPETTITFHDKKMGMNEENCGNIIIADIQIPKKAQTHVGPGELAIYYPRPKFDSHKGQNGRILIIGGGPFTGAPTLSALASLRTGADLVYIAAPEKAANIIASFSPNIIVYPLDSKKQLNSHDIKFIKSKFNQTDTVLIGPGLGSDNETQHAVRSIIEEAYKASKKIVIDADAIQALYDHHQLLGNTPCVITPHSQEFYKLTGETLSSDEKEIQNQIARWAKKLGVTLFLKGPVDVLSDGEMTRLNTVHNPAMTVGGTGDVLAGIISCLLAKNIAPMTSVRIAAFLNGEAGNLAFRKLSYGLTATDIIEQIPVVLNTYV
jgi:NAD(P)H-hydrate epimerase